MAAEINGGNGPRRQAAERAAINAPMQGTAADLIKLSMIAVDDWLTRDKLASRMIMQVHDELVLEVPDGELSLVRETARNDVRRGEAEGAAGGRSGRRRELGRGTLTHRCAVPDSCGILLQGC